MGTPDLQLAVPDICSWCSQCASSGSVSCLPLHWGTSPIGNTLSSTCIASAFTGCLCLVYLWPSAESWLCWSKAHFSNASSLHLGMWMNYWVTRTPNICCFICFHCLISTYFVWVYWYTCICASFCLMSWQNGERNWHDNCTTEGARGAACSIGGRSEYSSTQAWSDHRQWTRQNVRQFVHVIIWWYAVLLVFISS